MAKKKITRKAARKKSVKKKATKKKTPQKKTKKRKPATTEPAEMPAGRKSIKPFEVCNHFGVYLREIFEKEYSQNRDVRVGDVFEYFLRDLQGAWNMVKLYGKETPLKKLRGESNPFHYDL